VTVPAIRSENVNFMAFGIGILLGISVR